MGASGSSRGSRESHPQNLLASDFTQRIDDKHIPLRWTVATIALKVGFLLILARIVLAILSILGFRHANRAVVMVA